MAEGFVSTLPVVDYKTVVDRNCSFSAAQYRGFVIKNKTRKKVRDFLEHDLSSRDLGEEVGSLNYIEYSPKCFLKTKALQEHSLIPDLSSESLVPIRPSCFVDHHLKKGDVIISKDGNIGESTILEKDYPDMMLSGALFKLPLGLHKHYLLAFLKHALFRDQLDYLTPKGSVIRHCKTLFLDCEIPLPNIDTDKSIAYVERIVESIVDKERLIHERHSEIIRKISSELRNNQGSGEFAYKLPSLVDLHELGRLDSKPYSEKFKREIFHVKNYKYGFKTITGMGFSLSRGQNLQVSCIGDSIYSDRYYSGFYKLMLPKFLSKYGTCDKVEYLGNPCHLKTLKAGDLIFGAEGFEKGRSIVVVETDSKTITNIHGITIQKAEGGSIIDAVFIKCFLDYLREQGLVDMLAVGGNGGSLAQRYWGYIPFPCFKPEEKSRIARLYHNPEADFDSLNLNDDNFKSRNSFFDSIAGIYELDKAVKRLRLRLNVAIEAIANDKPFERVY